MDVPFIIVAIVSFCVPGSCLVLAALWNAVAHLNFVHLHSLWYGHPSDSFCGPTQKKIDCSADVEQPLLQMMSLGSPFAKS